MPTPPRILAQDWKMLPGLSTYRSMSHLTLSVGFLSDLLSGFISVPSFGSTFLWIGTFSSSGSLSCAMFIVRGCRLPLKPQNMIFNKGPFPCTCGSILKSSRSSCLIWWSGELGCCFWNTWTLNGVNLSVGRFPFLLVQHTVKKPPLFSKKKVITSFVNAHVLSTVCV